MASKRKGRPATGATKTKKSVTIDDDILAAAETHVAGRKGMSLSSLVENALEKFLAQSSPPQPIPASEAKPKSSKPGPKITLITAFREVPLLRAAAGFPILADAEMAQPDHDLGEGRFLLELRGDSMEPEFHDRQRVVLRDKTTLRRQVLKYGECYCFIHKGEATFKEWAKDKQGRKVLRSRNSQYPDILVTDQTDWIGWFDPDDNK